MDVFCHHPELEPFVHGGALEDPRAVRELRDLLARWQTLRLRPRPNGLFAAVPDGGRFAFWIRADDAVAFLRAHRLLVGGKRGCSF